MRRYPALVHRAGGWFGVSFPDFPGCIAAGTAFESAVCAAERALRLHAEGLREDGQALPPPSAADALRADPAWAAALADASLVHVPLTDPPAARATARARPTGEALPA